LEAQLTWLDIASRADVSQFMISMWLLQYTITFWFSIATLMNWLQMHTYHVQMKLCPSNNACILCANEIMLE